MVQTLSVQETPAKNHDAESTPACHPRLSSNHVDEFPCDRHIDSVLLREAEDWSGNAVQFRRVSRGDVLLHRTA